MTTSAAEPSAFLDTFFRRVLHAAGRPQEAVALADAVGGLSAALGALDLSASRFYKVTFDRSGRGWHIRPAPGAERTGTAARGGQAPLRAHRWARGAFAIIQRDEHGVARSRDDAPAPPPGARETVELVVVDHLDGGTTTFRIGAAPVEVAVEAQPEPVNFLAAFSAADLQLALSGGAR